MHAHDRDPRSWASQTLKELNELRVTSWDGRLTIVTGDRERPRLVYEMKSCRHLMITSLRSMLTIVTGDREHPRFEQWRMQLGHELEVLAHDRDCRSWAPQNEHKEWATYPHELEAHAHDRDMDRERTRLTFLARDTSDPDRDGFVPVVMLHITIVMVGRDKSIWAIFSQYFGVEACTEWWIFSANKTWNILNGNISSIKLIIKDQNLRIV